MDAGFRPFPTEGWVLHGSSDPTQDGLVASHKCIELVEVGSCWILYPRRIWNEMYSIRQLVSNTARAKTQGAVELFSVHFPDS